jgi:hypothetical protein
MEVPPIMTAATYPATPDGLTAALNALGDTAAEVADTLARAGFSGRRGDEVSCPIARYLRTAIHGAIDAYVGVADPQHDNRQRAGIWLLDGTGWFDVPMPPGSAAFIDAFDEGAYVELATDRDDHEPPAPGWTAGVAA